jgi:hypothetical protein
MPEQPETLASMKARALADGDWDSNPEPAPLGVTDDLVRKVTSVWRHPDGKTITVFADDTWICVAADGKKKPTSATPTKLRAGYGRWYEIEDPAANPLEARRVEE